MSDDTQMTLFTAEGLLRGQCRQNEKGIVHMPTMVWHAYMRWLGSQGESMPSTLPRSSASSWLLEEATL